MVYNKYGWQYLKRGEELTVNKECFHMDDDIAGYFDYSLKHVANGVRGTVASVKVIKINNIKAWHVSLQFELGLETMHIPVWCVEPSSEYRYWQGVTYKWSTIKENEKKGDQQQQEEKEMALPPKLESESSNEDAAGIDQNDGGCGHGDGESASEDDDMNGNHGHRLKTWHSYMAPEEAWDGLKQLRQSLKKVGKNELLIKQQCVNIKNIIENQGGPVEMNERTLRIVKDKDLNQKYFNKNGINIQVE